MEYVELISSFSRLSRDRSWDWQQMPVKFDMRTVVHDNSSGDVVLYNKGVMVIVVTFLSVVLSFILIGNTTVIHKLLLKKRRSRMNFYLLMLAIADMLVGVVLVIPDILEKFKFNYRLGDAFCKAHYVISVAVSCNAAYVLVCVSIDRLIAITRPLFIEHKCLRYSLLSASWALSFLNGIPMLLFRHTVSLNIQVEQNDTPRIDNIIICAVQTTKLQSRILVMFYAVMIFFLPLSVMIICHAIIIHELRTKNKPAAKKFFRLFIRSSRKHPPDRIMSLHACSARTMEILAIAKVKSVRMTLVIISAYIACWSPYFIFNVLNTFNLVHSDGLRIFTHSLGYLNSACNPLIFWIFRKRKAKRATEPSTRTESQL